MILNLLDLAKAEEGQSSQTVRFQSTPLVDEVIAELDLHAQNHEVAVRSRLDTDRIHADEDLFPRMLTNLVENAIRYAPAGTSIRVTATREVDGTELRVADARHRTRSSWWARTGRSISSTLRLRDCSATRPRGRANLRQCDVK
jgi:K+-sensing histidine kinase KdpD